MTDEERAQTFADSTLRLLMPLGFNTSDTDIIHATLMYGYSRGVSDERWQHAFDTFLTEKEARGLHG